MSKKKNFNFSIKAIEILDSCLMELKTPLQDTSNFQYVVNIDQRAAEKENMFFVICSITIKSDSKEEMYGQIKTSCIYQINDLKNYKEKDSGKIQLPPDFTSILNSISLSTTRGVMFSLFRGTYLHTAVLPVIDPKSLTML